jgi:hypothetical protein
LAQLVEEICTMNLLEIADLTELLRKRLNIQAPEPGAYMPGAPLAAGLPSLHACGHVTPPAKACRDFAVGSQACCHMTRIMTVFTLLLLVQKR